MKNFNDLFSRMSGSNMPVSRYLFNSVMVTLVAVAASVVISSTAAYALSRNASGSNRRFSPSTRWP